MALTISSTTVGASTGDVFVLGPFKCRMVDVTFDNSYPTGGESLTPSDLGMSVVYGCIQLANHSVLVGYDVSNNKLKAYRWNLTVAGGAAAAGTDALSIKSGVINKESAGAQTEQANFAEVENTADLSSVTVRLLFFGR